VAERIELFDVTVPAGTAIATPQTTALVFDPGIVERIEIVVPPGPSGLVGFQIRHSGETVIPHSASQWIIADNEPINWPVQGFPEGSAWSFRGYNLDVYSHTIYFRFHVNETVRSNNGRVPLVPIPPLAFAEDFTPTS